MQPFDYQVAHDEVSALKIHGSQPHSTFIAGGTNIIDLMKLNVESPYQLVDINSLNLHKISDHGTFVEVGALVNNNEMAHHILIKENFPFLSEAILSGASVQLRNLATTSGNLLQKTRCSYFRDPACGCNKRQPGSGCSAIDGFNRTHAIFGGSSHCIATHASDMCVPLQAMNAVILTRSPQGESQRQIPIADFYKLPGETPHIETVLQPGELITSIRLPKKTLFKKSKYIKIRDRASYAFALVSAALALEVVDGSVRAVALALGGVGTVPWRSPEFEKALEGQKLTLSKMHEAAHLAATGAKPQKFNSFKVELVRQTVLRSLMEWRALT